MRIALRSASHKILVAIVLKARDVRAGTAHCGTRTNLPGRSRVTAMPAHAALDQARKGRCEAGYGRFFRTPIDSEKNRQRFLAVHCLLQPAFLSRAETAANKRALLGYFYCEHLSELS